MSIKRVRLNLSIPPSRIPKIRAVGRQNRLHERDGSLKNTSVCTQLVYFFIDLHTDADVQAYLKRHGGTLFDLMRLAIKKLVKSRR